MAARAGLIGLEIDVTIFAGRGLVGKDGGGLFGNKKKTSDPFVKCVYRDQPLAKTEVEKKTLDPEWNANFKTVFEGSQLRAKEDLVFAIYDQDTVSFDDPMGEVRIPMTSLIPEERSKGTAGVVSERWHPVQTCDGCSNATGELHLKLAVVPRWVPQLGQREMMSLSHSGKIGVGLGWDLTVAKGEVDLDASCVCVSDRGEVLPDEAVYFSQLVSRSGAMMHTGDEREGDEDLGAGDDEVVVIDLQRLPPHAAAVFVIVTVATEERTFVDVKTARVRIVDWKSGVERCRYTPAGAGAHTALFLARIARTGAGWTVQMMGDVDHTARDWGALVPEIRGYMRDLVPGMAANPGERIALPRKGGAVRLADFCTPGIPPSLCMGLAWDVTNGVNIDLDASAIVLDAKLQPLDVVSFKKLVSSDGAIRHGGDEREGDAKGDDESIFLELGRVHPAVAYIGFVINSFSGQELDDVRGASLHLCDFNTRRDLLRYGLTNTKALDKHTALVVGYLRSPPEPLPSGSRDWAFHIVAEAAQGRTAEDNVDELQRLLARAPPPQSTPGLRQMPAGGGGAMLASRMGGLSLGGGGQPLPMGVPPPQAVAQAVPVAQQAVPVAQPVVRAGAAVPVAMPM